MSNVTDDSWIILGLKQMDVFDHDPVTYMNCLVAHRTLREIWRMIYVRAVLKKMLTPIEQVPVDIKNQLWTEAKEISTGLLNHEETIILSKALLTIKCFAGKL